MPLDIFSNFSPTILIVIAILTLITSTVHGATGVAGGFLLSAALAPIIGVKPIVPIMSIALLVSHSSRAVLNVEHFDKRAFFIVVLAALPCIILTAMIYGRIGANALSLILGSVILSSIPIRRWAKKRNIKANAKMLGFISAIYGGLSGVSIGPGMLLAPFMLGFGLSRQAFVATLAVIALVTNITRLTVFGFSDLLTMQYLLLGVMIGILTIPGNWFGRSVLRKITNEGHSNFVEVLTVLGAANFFWLALR